MSSESISQSGVGPLQELLYNVFQGLHANAGQRGIVVAMVAPHPGAGTTWIARQIVSTLSDGSSQTAACVDLRTAVNGQDGFISVATNNGQFHKESRASYALPEGNWRVNQDYRKECIEAIRSRFTYTLVDCPSLKESSDVLGMTRLVDGNWPISTAHWSVRQGTSLAIYSIKGHIHCRHG